MFVPLIMMATRLVLRVVATRHSGVVDLDMVSGSRSRLQRCAAPTAGPDDVFPT